MDEFLSPSSSSGLAGSPGQGFGMAHAVRRSSRSHEGMKSESAQKSQKITDTPEFKRWFGDSKVVDEQGRPLVVYHGTNKDFSKFKDGPVWFHTDPQQAFASGEGANVMPAYVKIERPIRRSGYFGMEDFSDPARFKFFDKAAGQWVTPDGVIGDNGVVVAFSPKQIKSAFAHPAVFNPNDPRVNFPDAAGSSSRQSIADRHTLDWLISTNAKGLLASEAELDRNPRMSDQQRLRLSRAIAQNQACDPGDDEPSEALRRLMRMTG